MSAAVDTVEAPQKHMSADQVVEVLARCFAKRSTYKSPDEDAVVWLTKRINKYIDRPWDEAGIVELRQRAKLERAENATLRGAAAILSRDLAGWRQLLPGYKSGSGMRAAAEGRIADLETTIATLGLQRGYLDQPGLTLRLSDNGQPPKPWALVAAGIADELHRVLRDNGDPRVGVGGPNGPVTKAVRVFLRIIMRGKAVPSLTTINESLENHLDQSLKHQRGGYSGG